MIQDILTFFLAWYNLPFAILLGLGMLMAFMQLIGLSQDSDSEADADADADVHVDHAVDLNHDVELDHAVDQDVDGDGDADSDSDLDHAPEGASMSGFSWLAYIGVGKAPLLVILLILATSISLFGLLFNGIVQGIFGFFPSLFILLTGLVSLIVGGLLTSRIAHFIGRALPPVSTTATRAQALVGMHGTVISPFVDNRYGMIHLRDAGSTLISVFAVTEDEQPIARGAEVILVSYDAAQRRYLVTRR